MNHARGRDVTFPANAPMSYLPIANHGLIGNLRTAAMVGLDGTVDFLPFPEFDSPTVFASLLDCERGGFFSIAPVLGEPNLKQLYLPDTCVLLTRFLADIGVAEITDFMPMVAEFDRHALIRRVATVRGEIQFRLHYAPRFDYGRADHDTEIARDLDEVVFRSRGGDDTVLRLRSAVPLALENGDAAAEFTLRAGEYADFFLEDAAQGAAVRPICASAAGAPSSERSLSGETGPAAAATAAAGTNRSCDPL